MSNHLRTTGIGRLSPGIYIDENYKTPAEGYCIPSYYRPLINDVILTRGQIRDRIEKLALDIHEHYKDETEDIVMVVTLKGATTFFNELATALRTISHFQNGNGINRPAYVEEFVRASSYVGISQHHLETSNDDVDRVIKNCQNKNVIIIEDLIDTGVTLEHLYNKFKNQGNCRSVRTACGFSKRTPRWNGFEPDWVGFDVKNDFIVGFGCDVNEHYRDLNHLSTISELGKRLYLS